MRARGERVDIEKLDGFEHIYQIDRFQKEFCKAFDVPARYFSLKGVHNKNKYVSWLRLSLEKLEHCNKQDMHLPDFEHIEYYDDGIIYVIRNTQLPKNPRVLYVYYPEEEAIILLVPFMEKHDHDYDAPKETARRRIDIIKRMSEGEETDNEPE